MSEAAIKRHISVIGLGYVGLPVTATFARTGAPVLAFDIDGRRIANCPKDTTVRVRSRPRPCKPKA